MAKLGNMQKIIADVKADLFGLTGVCEWMAFTNQPMNGM